MKMIFTLWTLFTTLNTFAQVTISGHVKDKKETIVGANIYLEGTYDGTSSDIDGNFSFKTFEKDTQVLKIDFVGYEPIEKTIFISDEHLKLSFILKEAFNEVNAVTITAGSFEAGDKKKTVVLNSIDQITVAGAQGDVTGALQTLPGTTTVGESGKLFVRGGSSDESFTFIDGTKVFKPYSSQAPNLSARGRFNPFMFKGTVFSTGGYSAEYGGALSSVLLLETNDLQAKDQLDFSIMSIGLDFAGTKTWKNGAVTATAGYTDLKPYMFLFKQKDDWKAEPRSFAGSVNLRQKTKGNGMLKFYTSYNNTFFNVRQTSVNDTTIRNNFALTNNNLFTNLSWKGRFSERTQVRIRASFNYDKDKILMNGNRLVLAIRGSHLKLKLRNRISEKVKINYGVEFLNNSFSQIYQDQKDSLVFDFQNNTYAAFAEADIFSSSKFVMRLGVRSSYADRINAFNVAPRVSMAYKFTKDAQLSFAYGMFYQNPKDEYLLYTKDLKQERADHYILNFQFDKKGRNLRAEVYYKDYRNLVKITDDKFYLPSSYNNEGKGFAYGLDLFYRDKKSIKNGDFWVSYSYINSKRDFRDFPSLATPNFVSTHNLSLVYKHWFPKAKSFVSATYQYSSPRVYTNPNIAGFNNQKLKSYNNLSLAWTYLYRQNVIFFASCTNVLGFDQEFGYEFADTSDANGVYNSKRITPGAARFVFMGCFITLSKDKMVNQVDKLGL